MNNNTSPLTQTTPLSSRHAEFLAFILEGKSSPADLRRQFSLSALELIEFFTAPAVLAAIESMTRTAAAALGFVSIYARDQAMMHLESVCRVIKGFPDPDARMVNNLRLAATQLGRLAHSGPSRVTRSRSSPVPAPVNSPPAPAPARIVSPPDDPLLPPVMASRPSRPAQLAALAGASATASASVAPVSVAASCMCASPALPGIPAHGILN